MGRSFHVQPFNNTLVKLDITGAGLREVLNAQISSYGPMLVLVVSPTLGTANKQSSRYFLTNGSKIDGTAKYTVTVNNYMAFHTTDK